jgi:hypothetical protein
MLREARLFTSSAGSVVRGYLKYRANIPPCWIKNGRGSRKRFEPEIAEGFRSLKRLRIRRPGEESRFGTRSGICALSCIAGRQPTAKRAFIEGYESSWNCSAEALPLCKSYFFSSHCRRVSCRSCPPCDVARVRNSST